MRFVFLAFASVALAACDSGTVPSPADRQAGNTPVQEVDMSLVAVHGDGLVAGAESFFFAAGQNEVNTALASVLGEPTESGENAECGAGPVEFATYPGGLTVHYQSGSFVGWNLSEAADNIVVDADVSIGTPLDNADDAPGFGMIEGSTLGDEFMVGNKLGGFLEEGAVSMLYAGTQCFSR
jgi:hypothetical protein